jgi:hypothetical protein
MNICALQHACMHVALGGKVDLEDMCRRVARLTSSRGCCLQVWAMGCLVMAKELKGVDD